jgi:hypothetical protein
MGMRYQKRVNLGGGAGLNLSKSGISSSYRTKYGSIGTKGFSIRTGIPGLSFRNSFGKSKGNEAIIMFFVIIFIGLVYIAAIVAWNILLLLFWAIRETYHLILRQKHKNNIKKDIELSKQNENVVFLQFNKDSIPEEYQRQITILSNILVENETQVKENSDLAIISVGGQQAPINALVNGKVTFYKFPGDRIKFGDYIYKIEKTI